jgi:hypothetical protein
MGLVEDIEEILARYVPPASDRPAPPGTRDLSEEAQNLGAEIVDLAHMLAATLKDMM